MQGTFNNSNVVRLNDTALDGVRNGSALAAVNVTDSYAIVAENTGEHRAKALPSTFQIIVRRIEPHTHCALLLEGVLSV